MVDKNKDSAEHNHHLIPITDNEALSFHQNGKPGKLSITPTKPLITQRDLALAYSPGVAVPCIEISKDPSKAYDYTSKGNFVAVITNGTAVLGLGDLGALASKPVMEGKAALFKRFADIDCIDIEVNTKDPQEFINCVKLLGASWGGINLEDIKSPECFIIEETLRKEMDIPVFHDDQHGTAIITLAGLINAAHITNRKFEDLKIVVNGAGAAGIACLELLKKAGVKSNNILLCDRAGVVYKGRESDMNPRKALHEVDTPCRTLSDALVGADVFMGLSVKGAVTKEQIAKMADKPIVFALANPDPEITPEEVMEVKPDAIIATGRSDYNNQVNNVMGFPYIFRGALDVRASTINDEMKIAAAKAIAELARKPVPEEVLSSYSDRRMYYGPEYIIPVPFDTRLITVVPTAVAKAAMDSGVARKPIENFDDYINKLSARLDPTYESMNLIVEKVERNPQRVIFSEGEEEQVIRVAILWRDQGLGTPILVGKEKKVLESVAKIDINEDLKGIEIWNAAKLEEDKINSYIKYFYERNKRKGLLYRDCVRLVKNDRNIFASCMLACGDGDALITGVTRGYRTSLQEVLKVIDIKQNNKLFGMSILIKDNKSYFISDTSVNETPSPEELCDIAIQTASKAASFGITPHVAFLSFANFGNHDLISSKRINDTVEMMKSLNVSFEFDGEITADMALNDSLMKKYFPFCKLTKPANVLIMPGLYSANISSKLLQSLGCGTLIGPILCGLEKPVQVIQMSATVADIFNLTAIAAAEAIDNNAGQ
jgi:malate dehydrogenase (oxaloacetate-decarboxylating)(NADP+)